MKKIIFALALLSVASGTLATTLAQASISEQSLRQPTPPSTQPVESAVSNTMFATQRFSFGMGSGLNSYGGNKGKLYQSSSPVLDFRFSWTFAPMWSLRVGADFSKHEFNAMPNGPVGVNLHSYHLVSQTHLLETALTNQGFDPYFFVSADDVIRRQTFQAHNTMEKDQALGLGAGLGTNFLFAGGKAAVWGEGGASKIFFRDRFEQEYIQSGIEDTTGLLYSARVGLKYYF